MYNTILAIIAILVVMGCNAPTTKPTSDMHNSYYIADITALPNCTIEREGQLFYVQSIESFVYCNNLEFQTIEIKGEKGDTGEAGQDGTDGIDGQDGSDGIDGTDGVDGEDGLAYLYDSNSTNIGRVLGLFYGYINVESPEGYYYSIQWDGNIFPSTVYFLGSGCTGTPYMVSTAESPFPAKSLFKMLGSSTLYTIKNYDSNGLSILSYITMGSYSYNGTCTNYTMASYYTELEVIDSTTAGVYSVTLPLSINN